MEVEFTFMEAINTAMEEKSELKHLEVKFTSNVRPWK